MYILAQKIVNYYLPSPRVLLTRETDHTKGRARNVPFVKVFCIIFIFFNS